MGLLPHNCWLSCEALKLNTLASDMICRISAIAGPDGAINIIFRKEIDEAQDKGKKRAELTEEYRRKFANPYVAAGLGYIDKVIFPHETRPLICKGLEMLASKRQSRPPKKHGNIPL